MFSDLVDVQYAFRNLTRLLLKKMFSEAEDPALFALLVDQDLVYPDWQLHFHASNFFVEKFYLISEEFFYNKFAGCSQ
jgi:hypothetical protein